jgi:3-hydroxyacyl-CoA dehydrogenase
MFWADSVGLHTVLAGINRFKEQFGPLHWQPAKLLEKLAREGKGFKDLDRG